MDGVDVAVIGAGVVGAAAAWALARDGHSVLLLEAGPRIAEGVTSRNSGVIHSGLYYPPGSLKAALCIEGNRRLYAWCQAKQVWHQKCGKLVVAAHEGQRDALEAIFDNARKSGAPGISLVGREKVTQLEPHIPAVAAMLCDETGIVDPYELTRSLVVEMEAQGGMLLTHARVTGIEKNAGYVLETSRGPVRAARVVNAAGLHGDDVARLAGIAKYTVYPWKGDYFRLKSAIKYSHLIYPVKDKAAPGLGVHLTLERGGGYRLGPDVSVARSKDDFSPSVDKLEVFRAAAERLLGPIAPEQLAYDMCGIRPKLRAPHESEEKDFVVSEDLPGFLNLMGIESPGLTASLAIAERVASIFPRG